MLLRGLLDFGSFCFFGLFVFAVLFLIFFVGVSLGGVFGFYRVLLVFARVFLEIFSFVG